VRVSGGVAGGGSGVQHREDVRGPDRVVLVLLPGPRGGLVWARSRSTGPGRRIDDEVLAHIFPAHSENINFFGAIEVDIEGELAQLGPTGYRSLRVRDTLF
jgi:hypothetical protein